MRAFEYLAVLVSIVIGLAITQVLQGLRGALVARERVSLHGPTLAWAATMAVLVVAYVTTLFSALPGG